MIRLDRPSTREFLALFAAAALLVGCSRGGAGTPAAPKTAGDWFAVDLGGHAIEMQIAVSEMEMTRGLMQRRSLGADQGMLFVYRRPTVLSFWMRDTWIPLDVGYFSPDGVLEEVYPMYPRDETPVRSRGDRLQFALEMNQGWFRQKGVRSGARLDLAAVRAALVARGFSPSDYGMAP